MGSVRIDRLDHLVLTVADIDATVEFCTRVLGMKAAATRYHLQGVNRGTDASASIAAWW